LASCYRDIGQINKSIEAIEKAITIAYQLKSEDIVEVFKKHQEILSLSGLSLMDIYKQAVFLCKNKNFPIAMNQLHFVIEKFDAENVSIFKKATCYSTLASCYRDIGDMTRAIDCCKKALSLCRDEKSLDAKCLANEIQTILEKMEETKNINRPLTPSL
jgi:tetratricopeptide (TPR) repeat protein